MDTLCVGHAAYDLIFSMDCFPAENTKHPVDSLVECGGGPAANAAFLLALWGVPTGLAALVGDDPYGHAIVAEMQKIGADTSLLEVRKGFATSLSAILVNVQGGSRTIINRTIKGDHVRLDPQKLAAAKPKVILVDGHAVQAGLDAIARYPNAKTVIDAGSLYEGTSTLVPKVDYIVASEGFAKQLSGGASCDTPEGKERAISGLKKVAKPGAALVVTLGERGLFYGTEQGVKHLPAPKVTAVDTTAAGDIFHGAFTYGVLQGMSLEENLLFSSRTAALSVTRPGGRTSIPTLEEVRRFAARSHE
jgi:sugar/nucleoside kinase (ribokinase family)